MGHLDVVDRLTEAKADLEAKGGEYSGGAPEACGLGRNEQFGRAILIVFGPKRFARTCGHRKVSKCQEEGE